MILCKIPFVRGPLHGKIATVSPINSGHDVPYWHVYSDLSAEQVAYYFTHWHQVDAVTMRVFYIYADHGNQTISDETVEAINEVIADLPKGTFQ